MPAPRKIRPTDGATSNAIAPKMMRAIEVTARKVLKSADVIPETAPPDETGRTSRSTKKLV
jgi:hypothetical protein